MELKVSDVEMRIALALLEQDPIPKNQLAEITQSPQYLVDKAIANLKVAGLIRKKQ